MRAGTLQWMQQKKVTRIIQGLLCSVFLGLLAPVNADLLTREDTALAMGAPLPEKDRYLFAALPPVKFDVIHCGTNEFPPFGYMENGQARGTEVDIVREIGQRLGLQVKISIYPWQRLLNMMKKGSLDCMFAAFYSPQRASYMDYTRIPIHVSRLALYVRSDQQFKFTRLEDLQDKHIGLIRGFRTIPVLDEQRDKYVGEVTYANSFEQLFKLLMGGRIDVVIVNHHVAEKLIHSRKLENIVELPYALSSNSAFITFSKKKGMENLVPKFEYALFEIMSEGLYQQYFQRHDQ